jgi:DNA-binding CsgD family transcriptional regulator
MRQRQPDVVRRTPFYNEIVRPHGLAAPLTMLKDTGVFQEMMCGEPERNRVRGEAARVYRIVATRLQKEWSREFVSAVALVERVEAKPMDVRELAARFSLTKREIETACLIRNGLSSRQIAAELGISVNTARRHTESILLKLDVHTRAAAAARLSGG